MQAKLREGAIDVCIALTDALVAGLANAPSLSSTGKPDAPSQAYKIVGRYIQTPLNWAVITGHSSPYSDVKDLRGTTIGISRLGSGSQTMASVMGLREGWTKEEDKLKFKGESGRCGCVLLSGLGCDPERWSIGSEERRPAASQLVAQLKRRGSKLRLCVRASKLHH